MATISFTRYFQIHHTLSLTSATVRPDFPGGSAGKESTCNAGDLGSIPGFQRSPGGGHGNLLQDSCLEKPHGQRCLEATVHGVVKSWTQLSS